MAAALLVVLGTMLPGHLAWRYWQLAYHGEDAPALVTKVTKERRAKS